MRQQSNRKKFYTLNLTEGRIFIVFLSIIIFSVIIFFAGAILLSKHQEKNAQNDINYEKSDNITEDLLFYDESQNEHNTALEISDNENQSEDLSDNNSTQVNEEELVKIDNTSSLYASNYNSSFAKTTNIKSNNIKKSITTTTIKKIYKTTKTSQNVVDKRYVIQIGSYLNKKFADDISYYFKQKGYPTYIKEKAQQNKIFYRLRVGPFKDKNKANEYLVAIKNLKYGDKSYISVVYF